MTTYDLAALRAFRAEVPTANTADVERIRRLVDARALESANERPRTIRPRAAIAIAFAALAVATAADAAIKDGPWWDSGAPPVDPQAVASVARDNLPAKTDLARARTVAQDGTAALVAVPIQASGYCLIPTLDGNGGIGAQCEYQVRDPERGHDDRLVSLPYVSRSGDASWIVYGRVTDPRAASVDLGALTVTLQPGGFFIARVPRDDWPKLSGTANVGAIDDRSGSQVRSGCVNWGLAPDARPAETIREQGTVSLWKDGDGPCKPPPSLPMLRKALTYSDAQTLFSVMLTHPYSIWKTGDVIRLDRASNAAGEDCIVAVADGFYPMYGGDCRKPNTTDGRALSPQISAQLVNENGDRSYVWSVQGRTASNVAKVVLRSPSGDVPVTVGGGYFFAQLAPTTSSASELPEGPYELTAYDASGRVASSVDLNRQLAEALPH